MTDKDVEFSEEAKLEFHKGKCFMEFIGKADMFWDDFERQIELIKQFPVAFQIRYRNVRIVPLEKFSYTNHYILKLKSILIYRILNQSQDF